MPLHRGAGRHASSDALNSGSLESSESTGRDR
jgi:hypothetical protein